MSAYSTAVLADSPLGFWQLQETSGTSAADSGSGANAGTYTGGFTLSQTGPLAGQTPNNAVLLNGTTGYVSIGNPANLKLTGASMTVAAWIKPTSTTPGDVLGHGTNSYVFYVSAGKLNFGKQNVDGVATTSAVVTANVWQYVAAVYTSGQVEFFLNGVSQGTKSYSTAFSATPAANLRLGADGSNGEFFGGTIAFVEVYSTAVSAARLLAHYNAAVTVPVVGTADGIATASGVGASTVTGTGSAAGVATANGRGIGMSVYTNAVLADSPLVYYRLGESSGAAMVDSSGNSSDGTYTGSPTLGVTGAIAADPNTAVTWNGTSQYGSAPAGLVGYQAGRGSLTVEGWVKYNGTDSEAIWGWTKGLTPADMFSTALFVDGTGALSGYLAANGVNPSSYITAGNFGDGAWHHAVMTWDGTTVVLYVDGVSQDSDNPSNSTIGMDGVADTLRAAAASTVIVPSDYLAGSLDELAIYPQALSAARVLAHYQAGIGLYQGIGTANGVATASGVGLTSRLGVGSAAGIATANAVGVAIPPATGGGGQGSRNFFMMAGGDE